MIRKTSLFAGGLIAFAAAGMAMAESTVTIGGRTFSCPNTCVVTVSPGGGWMVRDSKGEPITEITKPGSEQQ